MSYDLLQEQNFWICAVNVPKNQKPEGRPVVRILLKDFQALRRPRVRGKEAAADGRVHP
jgi:hypothetical protein